jgi:hypothetical protein
MGCVAYKWHGTSGGLHHDCNYCIHHLLPIRHGSRPEWKDLHHHRGHHLDYHRLPLHTHQGTSPLLSPSLHVYLNTNFVSLQPIATPSTVLYTSYASTLSGAASAAPPASVPANGAPVYSSPLTVTYSVTPTAKPTGTGSYTTKPSAFTGAASANKVGSFVVGAVAGVVALAL